jgi:putative endonuclease
VYYLYVLESQSDGNLYTGITSDVQRRLRAHNAGRVQSTRGRRPLLLIYVEGFSSRSEAFARESYFKTPEGGVLKQRLVAQRRLKRRPAR